MIRVSEAQYSGAVKRRKSYAARRAEYFRESDMSVDVRYSSGPTPDMVIIRLKGAIARIPSMKNSKIPGLNCPNPDVMAKVAVMDSLFFRCVRGGKVTFGNTPLHMTLICGQRGRRLFDEDNCFTMVKDWLEPSSKRVGRSSRPRGWGIGLTVNDTIVKGLPIKAVDIDFKSEDSIIILQPWSQVVCSVMKLLDALKVTEHLTG